MPVDLNSFGDFGRYKLIRRISLGGMAEVFKAKSYNDAGFEKIVALKRLLPSVAQDDGFVQMLIQEAQVAARLDHQNICRIYELGAVGERYYLTMEFIYGHDLRQAFKALKERGKTMDPWLVAWMASKVAEGLDFAYRADDHAGRPLALVHRDVSPQNVMIGFDGTIKIIDFGIAKVANATVQTAAGVLKGKYAYMSPEHAERRVLDARSDIWSLGVVLHELLRGKRLFVGSSMADTVDQVLHREVPPLTGEAPDALAAIVDRMLRRDLDERYPDYGEVLHDLHDFLGGSPAPVSQRVVEGWMDGLFPPANRIEADLTDEEMRLLFSAEERGEDTTDVRSDVSSATQIFLADETGQADYRAVLERLLAQGRVHTVITEGEGSSASADGEGGPAAAAGAAPETRTSVPSASSAGPTPGRTLSDAVGVAAGFAALVWLLLWVL